MLRDQLIILKVANKSKKSVFILPSYMMCATIAKGNVFFIKILRLINEKEILELQYYQFAISITKDINSHKHCKKRDS